MSLPLVKSVRFIDSLFANAPSSLDKKNTLSSQSKFSLDFKAIIDGEISEFDKPHENKITLTHRIINKMNDSYDKKENDLHLLYTSLYAFTSDSLICFEAAKKIISLGININSFYGLNILGYPTDTIEELASVCTYYSALDQAIQTTSSSSLVALLVINGAKSLSSQCWPEISKSFERALDPLFNRMKILILAKTDKESTLFKLLPKEMISEIAYNQLWAEAHTFREQIV